MTRLHLLCVAIGACMVSVATAQHGSVSVTVQDESGSPVQGADLSLLRWDGDWNESGIKAKSDADGKAVLAGLEVDTYLGLRVAAKGLATTMSDVQFSKPEHRELVLTLSPPVRPLIKVHDPHGRPIAGAEIHRMEFVDANKASVFITKETAHGLLHDLIPSDDQGRLSLPPIPNAAQVNLSIVHPKWKTVALKNLAATDGEIGSVTMRPGVPVRIELLPIDADTPSLDGLQADVRLSSSASRSEPVSIRHRFTIHDDHIDLTAFPVEYQKLTVELDDYFVTPYVLNLPDSPQPLLDLSAGQSRRFPLDVRPKVRARGKIVDGDGNPMDDVWVLGSIDAVSDRWPAIESSEMTIEKLRREWGSGGDTKSDRNGNYEIELAAGKAYVETIHSGYFNRPDIMQFEVSGDGSTQIPTITMLPVPILRGVVKDQDGHGVGGMLVRMRSRGRGDAEPLGATEDDGSFELKMSRIPYKRNGDGLVETVFVVAVDPKSNLAGIAEVDVSDADAVGNIQIELSPRSSDWVLHPIDDSEDPRYVQALEKRLAQWRKEFPEGIPGNSVPDLSAGTWLNSDARSLKDFHGRYVLLDFWFIGCGPCIRDMPSIKTAHDLFSDQGFSVVSIHRKGQTPESVRAYADANGMEYPIVVDNAEGTITEQYQALGVSGYPSYILLDPDGKIIHNDRVCLPPSLRQYKLERIYQALHQKPK